MKTLSLLIFATLLGISGEINAQRLLDFNPPPPDTLDYSRIRCLYEQKVLSDTTKSSKYTKNLMILQIGTNVSKYIGYLSFYTDSLEADDRKKQNDINIIEALKSGRYKRSSDMIHLFKNFPENKNTISNRIAYDSYIYEEEIIKPQWKIEKDKVTILGYDCIKATTTFCGRNYMVWFTPDIPISEGPWKFTGLPGLILRVHDDKGDVSFECTQIQKITWKDPILKYPTGRSTTKTTKDNFYKQLRKYCDNPRGFMGNNTRVTPSASQKPLPKLMYNPIELSE